MVLSKLVVMLSTTWVIRLVRAQPLLLLKVGASTRRRFRTALFLVIVRHLGTLAHPRFQEQLAWQCEMVRLARARRQEPFTFGARAECLMISPLISFMTMKETIPM